MNRHSDPCNPGRPSLPGFLGGRTDSQDRMDRKGAWPKKVNKGLIGEGEDSVDITVHPLLRL